MVAMVESLMVLNCSKWFPSTLFSSALGSTKPFSEAGKEWLMLPDMEWAPKVLRGKLLCPVDWDTLARCLEPLLEPRSRDVCVHLLYVFRMMSRMERMMMMPMTMTAIIAPEL